MKAWEYIFARGISKIFENIQKEEEKQARQLLKSQERKMDKGSWVYKAHEECFDFVPPKKNPYYVTEQPHDGDAVTVIISKKPLSLESLQFDYPWEAEDFCEQFYSPRLDDNANIIFKRDAPVLIADNDIACPYCKNSRPPISWIKNSLEQELQEVPYFATSHRSFYEEQLELSEFPIEHYWCPICRCQVKADLMIKKGEEWKIQYLKDIKISTRVSPLRAKNILDCEEKERAEKRNGVRGLQEKISNPARPLLQFKPSLLTPEYHQGLMVKAIIKIDTKSQEIHKTKWIRASSGITETATVDMQATSYLHKDDKRSYLEKRYRQLFPLRYYPINEINTDELDRLYKKDINKIEELTRRYHKGEPLPILEITYDGKIMGDLDIISFATDMGFTHIPVIICGPYEKKKATENKYKDEATIIMK